LTASDGPTDDLDGLQEKRSDDGLNKRFRFAKRILGDPSAQGGTRPGKMQI